jgi:hypothetical protein
MRIEKGRRLGVPAAFKGLDQRRPEGDRGDASEADRMR